MAFRTMLRLEFLTCIAPLLICHSIQGQNIVTQPVTLSPWMGFGADFQPVWSGLTKRVDYPAGDLDSGSGIVISRVPPSPPVPDSHWPDFRKPRVRCTC